VRLVRAAATVVFAAAGGCSGAAPELPDFADVTRIVVTERGGKEVATITEARRIDSIVEFVNARNSGWTKPWSGVPVPGFGATFWAADRCEGSFGAGPLSFETQREGDFFSRAADPDDVAEYARLLGVTLPKPR
jgi:hypothetical protein